MGSEKTLALGIDLGGTNSRCAVVDNTGKVLLNKRVATPENGGFDAVSDTLAQLVEDTVADSGRDKSEFIGTCAACPGIVNSEKGIVYDTPNLQLKDVPLGTRLTEQTGIKTILENDANAAGYGEFFAGVAKGCSTMLMLTIGTGIGGAIVLNNKLWKGIDGLAGEIGHLIVENNGRPCGCGGKGCIETYASAASIRRRFVEQLEAGRSSTLAGIDDYGMITCEDIFKTAENDGDELALEIVDSATHYIANLCAGMANLLNPEMMVIYGGVIAAGDFLFDKINAEYKILPFKRAIDRMKIVPAKLGGDAGVIGAAGCVFDILGPGIRAGLDD